MAPRFYPNCRSHQGFLYHLMLCSAVIALLLALEGLVVDSTGFMVTICAVGRDSKRYLVPVPSSPHTALARQSEGHVVAN